VSETVFDSSIALTWRLKDEATSETDALFERVRDQGAVVPSLYGASKSATSCFRSRSEAGSRRTMSRRDSI
jgi:hypothetical protein